MAVESVRETLRAGMVENISRCLEREIAEQQRLFATEDFREGVLSVTERRPGRWQNR